MLLLIYHKNSSCSSFPGSMVAKRSLLASAVASVVAAAAAVVAASAVAVAAAVVCIR